MVKVLHIIDESTPPDMLDALSMLGGDRDLVASIGPAPRVEIALPIRTVHCPMSVASLAGRQLRKLAGRVEIVHAWSCRAAVAARSISAGARILSLPCAAATVRPDRPTRLALESVDCVTVPTEASRQAMLEAGPNRSGVEVLPPAAEPLAAEKKTAQRHRVRHELGISQDQCLLVAPSPMLRDAGHKYASWAHAIVRQIRGDLLLLLPGGGPVEPRVRHFAGTTGYDDEVFLTAHRFSRTESLAAADIALFLPSADMGVSTLVAAMAGGVPVIITQTPDQAECAPPGQASLGVPKDDPRAASSALLRLIEQPELAQELASAARDRAAERFSRHGCRSRLDLIYSEAMALGGSRLDAPEACAL